MNDMDTIKANPTIIPEGVRGFLREMLKEWLQNTREPRLEDIIEALQRTSVGEERLAAELKLEFSKQKGKLLYILV